MNTDISLGFPNPSLGKFPAKITLTLGLTFKTILRIKTPIFVSVFALVIQ